MFTAVHPILPAKRVRTDALDEVVGELVAGLQTQCRRFADLIDAGVPNAELSARARVARQSAFEDARTIQRYLDVTPPARVVGSYAEWAWTVNTARDAGI